MAPSSLYESINFRVNDLFKNPHCTKYISHRTICTTYFFLLLEILCNWSPSIELRFFFVQQALATMSLVTSLLVKN